MDLVLYGAPLSPFVRKVEVLLREKNLAFDSEMVGIPIPDWFAEISPGRRMPALRDRDVSAEGPEGVIPDSSAICAYLERLAPEPSFYPEDAFELGRALWYEEYADSDLSGCMGPGVFRPIAFARFAGKEPDIATARTTMTERMPRFFDYLEGEIRGREYFVGDAISIADVAVATQLINLELVVGPPNRTKWPELVAHLERTQARTSFEPNLAICRKILKEPVELGL